MKTAIIYYSKHHENTKKVLDTIAEQFPVTLIDVTNTPQVNLESYDLIGVASGIYYSKFHKSLLQFAEHHLPKNKHVFFVYTCGAEKKGYTSAIRKIAEKKQANIIGEYGCLGFDSFGPFKLVGGIAKGHPNQGELANAVRFFETISHELLAPTHIV